MPESREAQANAAIRKQMGLATGTPQGTPQTQPGVTPSTQTQQTQQTQKPEPPAGVSLEQYNELKANMEQTQKQLQAVLSQNNQIAARSQSLEGELAQLRENREDQSLQLPSDDELQDMPRGEAIRRVAEGIAAKQMRELEKKFTPAFQRLAGDFVGLRTTVEEDNLRKRFPKLDLEKYRLQLDEKRLAFPQATLGELVQLVADPVDLMQLASDTTQTTQEDVHMETGAGASTGGGTAGGQTGGPQLSEGDLQQGLLNARQAGNKMLADRYLMEIIKRRPDVRREPQGAAGG